MEQCGRTYPAPALARGLAVLRLLGADGPMTLEQIARRTKAPKSSLLRILATFIELGLVRREGRQYHSRGRLVPTEGRQRHFEEKVAAALERITSTTRQTAEWYVPAEEGMLLIRRAAPESHEVRMLARVGFVRPWRGELDAVAAVGNAFLRRPPRSYAGFSTYVTDGVWGKLSAAQTRRRIDDARRTGLAADKTYNSNGVRRIACIVGQDGKPTGVLAIAQHLVPAGVPQAELVQAMLREARELCRDVQFPFLIEE